MTLTSLRIGRANRAVNTATPVPPLASTTVLSPIDSAVTGSSATAMPHWVPKKMRRPSRSTLIPRPAHAYVDESGLGVYDSGVEGSSTSSCVTAPVVLSTRRTSPLAT